MSPVDMEAHINECTYKRSLPDSQIIYCSFKNVGCMETFHNEEDLHAHVEGNINIHLTVSPIFFVTFNYNIKKIILYRDFIDDGENITTVLCIKK